eukprot:28466-Eustigmatos_ZCMA.PRE.1
MKQITTQLRGDFAMWKDEVKYKQAYMKLCNNKVLSPEETNLLEHRNCEQPKDVKRPTAIL